MGFVDSHVHLYYSDYDSDREEVIRKAKQSGIDAFINVGTNVETSLKCLDMAQTDAQIYATAGIHPNDSANALAGDLQAIEKMLTDSRMVAVGEVGLDFFREHSPQDKQREILSQFFKIQKRIQKPLVLHCRNAYSDLYAMLHEEYGSSVNGVMHCYSSDAATMKDFLDLGLYISFAGPLTYKKNEELREACRLCPKDRLLLETDAPFLPPQSSRGKRNDSSLMLETAQMAADIHGLSLLAMGEITSQNARRLFRL